MKQIPLTKGKIALVDDEDYDLLMAIGKWQYSGNGYASSKNCQTSIDQSGASRKAYMHRIIMNAPKGKCVDHIDGNALNNQKSNLRICTSAENLRNRGRQLNNKSGFKGVQIERGRFRAQIRLNNKNIHIGFFDCIIEAAKAYNAAALKYHGEFAYRDLYMGRLP